MSDIITNNPILSSITAITSILSILNGFLGSFGLAPFVADLMLSSGVAGCLVYWIYVLRAEQPPPPRLFDADGHAIELHAGQRSWGSTSLRYFGAIALSAVLLWTGYTPVAHLGSQLWTGSWKLCGVFRTSCNGSACLRLLDGKGRPIDSDCFSLLDASGYGVVTQAGWWVYRPSDVSGECDSVRSAAKSIPDEMYSPLCHGEVDLQ